jgi:hypothetical protein
MADGYPNEIPLISSDIHAVSMQHALSIGFAGGYSNEPQKGVKIDLVTESEGQKAILSMIDSGIAALARSPTIKNLLAKPSWSMRDREQWERSIAHIARDAIHDEPRFGPYRLDRKKAMTPISLTDITKDTNFHCEPMAALTGVIVQKLENHFLEPSDDKTNLKRRTDYYLTGGVLYESAYQKNRKPVDHNKAIAEGEIFHSYVVSPITANYFEGTVGRPAGWHAAAESPYKKNDVKGYTFEDYLAGFPMFANRAGFTVGYDGSPAAQKLAQDRKAAILRGDYSALETRRVKLDLNSLGQTFSDERNLLKLFSQCSTEKPASSNRAHDDVAHINTLLAKSKKDSGRNYSQLSCDVDSVDFAMTSEELDRAYIGNRILHWSNNKGFASAIIQHGLEAVSGKKEWNEKDLVAYLGSKGISEVWVKRIVPAGVSLTGNNFEDVVRGYYNSLPAENLTIESPKGDEKIPFELYLKFCRDQFIEQGGKAEYINAPGTVVPVIYNPLALYGDHKESNGRTMQQYLAEDIPAGALTRVVITNRPGVNRDQLDIKAIGIINGNNASVRYTGPVDIPESTGELPNPLPTRPDSPAKPSPRQAVRP